MGVRALLKRAIRAGGGAVGDFLPAVVRQRLPPRPDAAVRVAAARAGAPDDGMSVLYWEEVPPRTRPLPTIGRPAGWPPFAAEREAICDPLFVASVPGARVFGRFACVMTAAGRVVTELSRVGSEPIATHPVFTFAVLPRPHRLPGRTLLLAGAFGDNYYHWFSDTLPRLELLARAGVDRGGIDHVLVSSSGGPYAGDSLRAWPDLRGAVRVLSNRTHFVCDELISPSLPHRVGEANEWGPAEVCRRVLGRDRAAAGSHRLYVSRALAGRRRLTNEALMFRDVLAPRGFESVHLERMGLRDQAALFADARVVVAPHGAGLTNLIYAPRGCAVVELLSADYPALCFWKLSDALGLDYRYAVGRTTGPAALPGPHRDFEIDPTDVAACVEGL